MQDVQIVLLRLSTASHRAAPAAGSFAFVRLRSTSTPFRYLCRIEGGPVTASPQRVPEVVTPPVMRVSPAPTSDEIATWASTFSGAAVVTAFLVNVRVEVDGSSAYVSMLDGDWSDRLVPGAGLQVEARDAWIT
jgi:hypothetical protein